MQDRKMKDEILGLENAEPWLLRLLCFCLCYFPSVSKFNLIFAVVHSDNDVCMVATATSTIAIYYNYSHQKLILIVESY